MVNSFLCTISRCIISEYQLIIVNAFILIHNSRKDLPHWLNIFFFVVTWNQNCNLIHLLLPVFRAFVRQIFGYGAFQDAAGEFGAVDNERNRFVFHFFLHGKNLLSD